MDVENREFRKKVFDQDILSFCLELIQFFEKMPERSPLLKRAVVESLAVNSSVQDARTFFRSLNSLPLSQFAPHMEEFLDASVKLAEADVSLDDYLTTLRHLAEHSDFAAWTGFFALIGVVGDKSSVSGEYFMTVRHLVSGREFSHWEEFYTASKVAAKLEVESVDFFVTTRNLVATADFKDWRDFFATVGVVDGTPALGEFLMTIRHLSAQVGFREWPDFFVAVKAAYQKSPDRFSQFLLAVRHSISYFSSPDSLRSIFKTLASAPQYSEACAYGQLDSKKWLIDEARRCWPDGWGTVFVLAGWIGFLPRFIFEAGISVKAIRSFDLDPGVGPAAELLNQTFVQQDWKFKSSTMDITQLNYPSQFRVQRKDGSFCDLYESPDLVINTSCEHLADIEAWWGQIPSGTRVILQSNDGFHIPEHVRCYKTLADFEAAMSLGRVDYRGEKPLADFNRFMLIGIK